MLECKRQVVETCAEYGVAAGHPHVTDANLERVLEDVATSS